VKAAIANVLILLMNDEFVYGQASLVGALADPQPGIFVEMISLGMFLYIQFNQFLVCLYVRSGRDYF
jgi:hypothetical protein